MNLMVNPVITAFQQETNGDIKMLKLGENQEDAYANIIGQAEGADLENNKAATIDVSTYTQPVEVTPTSGKDGMKKATITLSNIPSPSGFTTLYAWADNSYCVYTTTTTPTTESKAFIPDNEGVDIKQTSVDEVGEDTITVNGDVYTRDNTKDITL